MSGPVTHIRRTPLPWRDSDLTECGRPVAEYAMVIDLDEARRRVKDLGQQRFIMLHCVTCSNTVGRWASWESDPLERIGREARGNQEQMVKELRAIAALIAAHRDEFDEYVVGLEQTGNLAAKRAARRLGR